MGYVEYINKDGERVILGDPTPADLAERECCDVCNEPKLESDLIKKNLLPTYLQKSTSITDDAIWICSQCKGVNKS